MVRSDFCNTVHRFVCCIHIYGSEITTSSNCQALFIFGNPLLYNCTIYTDDRYMYFKCSKIPPVSNCVDKEISWNKQRVGCYTFNIWGHISQNAKAMCLLHFGVRFWRFKIFACKTVIELWTTHSVCGFNLASWWTRTCLILN